MITGVPVLGTGSDIMNFVYRDQITEIIITGTQVLSGETFQGVMDAYERGVVIIPMTLLYERITGRVPVEHVNNDWAVVFLPMKIPARFSIHIRLSNGQWILCSRWWGWRYLR